MFVVLFVCQSQRFLRCFLEVLYEVVPTNIHIRSLLISSEVGMYYDSSIISPIPIATVGQHAWRHILPFTDAMTWSCSFKWYLTIASEASVSFMRPAQSRQSMNTHIWPPWSRDSAPYQSFPKPPHAQSSLVPISCLSVGPWWKLYVSWLVNHTAVQPAPVSHVKDHLETV